jgi:hypothetical protein
MTWLGNGRRVPSNEGLLKQNKQTFPFFQFSPLFEKKKKDFSNFVKIFS